MTVLHTKREAEFLSHSSEDLILSLKYQIISWGSRSISKAREEEVLRLLESLKTVILAKQARAANSTTI